MQRMATSSHPQNPSGSPATGAPVFSPLYQQIKALILRSLQSGEWKPGELIPSEAELATRYGVSQGTVRKAVDELSADNLLMRRQGRGTFVTTHHEEQVKFRFLRLVPDDDSGSALRMEREFLACHRVRAAADVARLLGVKSGDMVLEIRRVLRIAGRPLVYEDIYLPATTFRGLTAERLEGYKGPLYAMFESEFGTRMVRAEEKIRAVCAGADEAALLQVDPGQALLSVERLSFSYGDQAVELRRGLYVTTHHHYRNTLS
ncbi:putative HTH-type transcriptional regulator YurK [mine drainage metagenome]|jgi:GntR family transcriptional regulator|uniref:Putative HTH-type transcriptional regulator YurK n=1 Tax=mine drainage metagenome TaxID=410659 RepID=A0A1J5R6E7_9ZZZZ